MLREQRAVLLLMGLAVAGHGARAVLGTSPAAAPGAIEVLGAREAHAALARRDSLARLARPLGPHERLDAELASSEELTRLPGVGPALARRIVADRTRSGPFGDLEGLDRVPGLGPALLARLSPHLSFRGRPAVPFDTGPAGARARAAGSRRGIATDPAESGRASGAVRMAAPPGILSQPPWGGAGAGPVAATLNAGSVTELDRLPGIGPTRARRIVAYRDSVGPFRSAADLARVPGISLALATRLWSGMGGP